MPACLARDSSTLEPDKAWPPPGEAAAASTRPRYRPQIWPARRLPVAGATSLFEKGRVIATDAQAAIAAYEPHDPRERGFRERMLALLEHEASLSRGHFSPGHLTASAFVISPAADELLLIFHRKLGIWVQPGGHIEPGDASLLEAARREVAEEVGLSLSAEVIASIFDLDIHPIPARGVGDKAEPAHEHFDVRYCLRSPTRDFVASDEVADARWVQLATIDQVTSDESVLRAARKLAVFSASPRSTRAPS